MKLNSRGGGYLNEEQAQKALLDPWDPDMNVDDELAAMENMACYETVLNDIRRSYLDGLTTLAEGETETVNLEELAEKVSQMRRIRELEGMTIRFCRPSF